MTREQVRWEEVPTEIRVAVEPFLLAWLSMLPSWVEEVVVRYDDNDSENTISIKAHYPNRWAVMAIAGGYLSYPEDEREVAIIHELVHVIEEPYTLAVANLLDALLPKKDDDDPLYLLVRRTFKDGMEQTVEDLARAMVRMRAHFKQQGVEEWRTSGKQRKKSARKTSMTS
jgi:hypothetical protein